MPLVLMTQKRVEQLVAAVAEAAGLTDAAPTAQQAAQLAHADLVSLELHVTRQYSSAYSSCWPPKVPWTATSMGLPHPSQMRCHL